MSALDSVRAVTFWRWNGDIENDQLVSHNLNPLEVLGVTWGSRYYFAENNDRMATIPNATVRVVLNLDAFDNFHSSYPSDSLWQVDYPLQLRRAISHEFGHTVGMIHPALELPRNIMTPARRNIAHRFIFVFSDSLYSDSSKAEISIKGE
jgi:hypothetical protein